jgi:hypothetical protein
LAFDPKSKKQTQKTEVNHKRHICFTWKVKVQYIYSQVLAVLNQVLPEVMMDWFVRYVFPLSRTTEQNN